MPGKNSRAFPLSLGANFVENASVGGGSGSSGGGGRGGSGEAAKGKEGKGDIILGPVFCTRGRPSPATGLWTPALPSGLKHPVGLFGFVVPGGPFGFRYRWTLTTRGCVCKPRAVAMMRAARRARGGGRQRARESGGARFTENAARAPPT